MATSSRLQALPDFFKRRIRVMQGGTKERGDYVLYWMCTAARAEENPALDTARLVAQDLNIPLLVYHGLSYRYPYASDRHHQFILEGARDVEQDLGMMGISYAFHLERPGDPPVLKDLASRAALVVTENFPTPPLRNWLKALMAQTNTEVWSVDTTCLVSLECSRTLYKRAFTFRDDLASERKEALHTPYPHLELAKPKPWTELPHPKLPLADTSLSDLIASCPIDHTVPPVRDTVGGSRAALARWNSFLSTGLSDYHARRNDAAVPGVSRMSAYLHYGHISPFRLAREAHEHGGRGGKKFLDELLIWRELAYHWCDKVSDPEAWNALPNWARESLQEEAMTPRQDRYAWESLARAKTHDELWNLAQRSLLHHGELHNNLRMTWGKMIHAWTDSPKESLRWLIDLNNRYALDGRDPASYGGLLWCLGLFDRPFNPPQPVFGTVRSRSSAAHARRLDVETYKRHLARDEPKRSIAVLGAGLAGLLCARTLHDHRYRVTVFDKARSPGGRSSSRVSRKDALWSFDHGAPYFTATDSRVSEWLQRWEGLGVLNRWDPIPEASSAFDSQLFVGRHTNHALANHLASELTIQPDTRIVKVRREADGWWLSSPTCTHGPYDVLVFNLPGPQAIELWPKGASKPLLPTYTPAHAMMMRFDSRLDIEWDVFKPLQHPVLHWICRETSKPGRPAAEQWVVQTQPCWSTQHLETDLAFVQKSLVDSFAGITHVRQKPTAMQTHRWRYARPLTPLPEGSFWDAETALGACGDAWRGGVEGALLSGGDLAGHIMRETR